jgi:hypothetical protein
MNLGNFFMGLLIGSLIIGTAVRDFRLGAGAFSRLYFGSLLVLAILGWAFLAYDWRT